MKGRGGMNPYHGRDVQYCATCVWIRHQDPHGFICARLGYQTKPQWKFRCWVPRERYREEKEDTRHE